MWEFVIKIIKFLSFSFLTRIRNYGIIKVIFEVIFYAEYLTIFYNFNNIHFNDEFFSLNS